MSEFNKFRKKATNESADQGNQSNANANPMFSQSNENAQEAPQQGQNQNANVDTQPTQQEQSNQSQPVQQQNQRQSLQDIQPSRQMQQPNQQPVQQQPTQQMQGESNLQASQMIDLENLSEKYGITLETVQVSYDTYRPMYQDFTDQEAHEMTIVQIEKKLEDLGEIVHRDLIILGKYWEYWKDKPNENVPERVRCSVVGLVYNSETDKNELYELSYIDKNNTRTFQNLLRCIPLAYYDSVLLRQKGTQYTYYTLDPNSYFDNPKFLAELDEDFANYSLQQTYQRLLSENFVINKSWEDAGFSKKNNGFVDSTDIKAFQVTITAEDYKMKKKVGDDSPYSSVYYYEVDVVDFGRNSITLKVPSFPEYEPSALFKGKPYIRATIFGVIDQFAGKVRCSVYNLDELQ